MAVLAARPARITGWIPISGGKSGGKVFLGGLVDVSRTGARIYLSWNYPVGAYVPLAMNIRGEPRPISLPARVVWVKKDEDGVVEAIESRIHLMRDLVHAGQKGLVYGWLHGVRFEGGVRPEAVRLIQKHLEEQKPDAPKQAFIQMTPDYRISAPGFRPDVWT